MPSGAAPVLQRPRPTSRARSHLVVCLRLHRHTRHLRAAARHGRQRRTQVGAAAVVLLPLALASEGEALPEPELDQHPPAAHRRTVHNKAAGGRGLNVAVHGPRPTPATSAALHNRPWPPCSPPSNAPTHRRLQPTLPHLTCCGCGLHAASHSQLHSAATSASSCRGPITTTRPRGPLSSRRGPPPPSPPPLPPPASAGAAAAAGAALPDAGAPPAPPAPPGADDAVKQGRCCSCACTGNRCRSVAVRREPGPRCHTHHTEQLSPS